VFILWTYHWSWLYRCLGVGYISLSVYLYQHLCVAIYLKIYLEISGQIIFIFHLVTHQMHYILNLLGQLYIFILVNNLNFLLKQPLGQYMLALIER